MNRLIYLVAFMLLLTACHRSSDADLARYIEAVKARPSRPVTPMLVFPPIEKFVYPDDPNRRSPFKPKIIAVEHNVLAPDMKRRKEPLEQFPLESLKFVGILKQGNIIWGLIATSQGSVMRVKVGGYMGQQFGRVTQLTENALTLEEMVRTEGKWEKKVTVFKLNARD